MKIRENADANPIPAGITPRMSRGRSRGKPVRDKRELAKKLVDSLLAKKGT
jgi:hypothetical protein